MRLASPRPKAVKVPAPMIYARTSQPHCPLSWAVLFNDQVREPGAEEAPQGRFFNVTYIGVPHNASLRLVKRQSFRRPSRTTGGGRIAHALNMTGTVFPGLTLFPIPANPLVSELAHPCLVFPHSLGKSQGTRVPTIFTNGLEYSTKHTDTPMTFYGEGRTT